MTALRFTIPTVLLALATILWAAPLDITPPPAPPDDAPPNEPVQTAPSRSGMNPGQAVVLGLVEGLTEYLPVSSTGHLLVVQNWMGIGPKESADAYAICIQAGAILAVLGLYFRRVRQMAVGILGKDDNGRRLAINLVVAFVPAMIIGLAFNDRIKANLFGMWPIITAWFVGGVAILIVAWSRRGKSPRAGASIDLLTWKTALIIGVAQCLAMWPGTSRSLVTIVGAVLVGLSLPAAVEFSFLLGVITLGAATCHDAYKYGQQMLETYGSLNLALGFLFAFLSAVIAIKWMVAYLSKHGLVVFGYYRVAIAIITAALILAGLT